MGEKKNGALIKSLFSKLSGGSKICVLDTNVLIHNPQSVLDFEDNGVVIADTVIEELDEMKKGNGEIPYSARQALKLLNILRKEGKSRGENFRKGIRLPGGGILASYEVKHNHFHQDKPDNRIVSAAMDFHEAYPGRKVIMVSKDVAVQLKAEAKGVNSNDYTHDKTSIFKKYGNVLQDNDYNNGIESVRYHLKGSTIDRIIGRDAIQPIRRGRQIWGIRPKNIGQECAIDALTCPQIQIIALTGVAGTGKTLLALAAALNQTVRERKGDTLFDQVIVARPIIPMGNDLGYLPGDIIEKMNPWMQPIYDNLEVIVPSPSENGKDESRKQPAYQYLIDGGQLQVEPLTYIRGRSLPKRYFIVDEAQNLRPIDVKTIVTRCGDGTKIVFTGDLQQIDTPFLDAESNGLAYLIGRYINEPEFCYLNLSEGARSPMAAKAARLL